MERCPCGSGRSLAECCAPWLAGAPAPTAETLMRSRYTAYVLRNDAYLAATWHPSTRPSPIDSARGPRWIGLTIVAAHATGEHAAVEFIARYQEGRCGGALHETSRFVREGERWYYLDGIIHPAASTRVGRNDPCPCGSGRKFKRCCGA